LGDHNGPLGGRRPAGHVRRRGVGPPEEAVTSKMSRAIVTTVVLLLLPGAAPAQDVKGIELCTQETRMDRRTGCLQSNVEYLHGLIAKTAADAQQKVNAASAEIGALKGEIGALKAELAALKAALAAAQANVEKLSKRAPDKPAPDRPAPDKPTAK
jgi:septal ring factor EnvC (AmiA/AmiB activator)